MRGAHRDDEHCIPGLQKLLSPKRACGDEVAVLYLSSLSFERDFWGSGGRDGEVQEGLLLSKLD